ncbi:MAG TPA: hypothetical protein H9986_06135 [Candidatus Prevotella stercoripullorum]|nr:hypothetical protein [Candidatus Prevotella stercoripullorum]
MDTSMKGSKRVSLMIKKPQTENVQVELEHTVGEQKVQEKVIAWYDGNDTWKKLVFDYSKNAEFDNPGLIIINTQKDKITGSQEVYIDNVVIEPATKVDGKLLSEVADGSLTGNITLTGAWMNGDCTNVTSGNEPNHYDDFAALKAKLSSSVTSIDMTQDVVLKDAYNAFLDVNPNIIVYADEAVNGDNVVINSVANNVVIKQDGAFSIPTGFTAKSVTVEKPLSAGYNALVLPFDVTAAELGAEALSTCTGVSGDGGEKTVVLADAETVAANTPMVTKGAKEAQSLVFGKKAFKATPAAPASGEFKGVYAPQSAKDMWRIGGDGTFSKGAGDAQVTAFGAYWDVPGATALSLGTSTGITGVEADGGQKVDVYTIGGVKVRTAEAATALDGLAKGVYIVAGKKYVVR